MQKAGDSDRRQRLLFATAKGEALVAEAGRPGRPIASTARLARSILPARIRCGSSCGIIYRDDPDKAAGDILEEQRNREGMIVPEVNKGCNNRTNADATGHDVSAFAAGSHHLTAAFASPAVALSAGEGYRVTTAMSAKDAGEKPLGLHFDLLILDADQRPARPASTSPASSARRPRRPSRPTARHVEPKAASRACRSAPNDHVAKPFEPRELSLRIGNILKRATPLPVARVEESIAFGPYVTIAWTAANCAWALPDPVAGLTAGDRPRAGQFAGGRRGGAVVRRSVEGELLRRVIAHEPEVDEGGGPRPPRRPRFPG